MKSISSQLLAHLQGKVLTICTLWRVSLTNGSVLGFTDHDTNVAYSGVTYLAASGYTRSDIQNSADLTVDNLEIQGLLTSPSITEDALLSGLWDYARIDIYLVNWADLTMGSLYLRTGYLGQVTRMRNSFTAELRGLTQLLAQNVGEVATPSCRADLGDSRCTVTLASFTVTGTVTSIVSNRIFNDSSRTEADGYFNLGKLTWTSGANSGISMEAKVYIHSGGQFQLSLPMYYPIAVNDTYSVYAGCDKQRATCRDKFNNIVNMQAEPDAPGLDKITVYVPQ